jgi:hypothetical protein
MAWYMILLYDIEFDKMIKASHVQTYSWKLWNCISFKIVKIKYVNI